MSTYSKMEHHPSMDPDVWELYLKVWEEKDQYKKMSSAGYYNSLCERQDAQIQILEALLEKYIGAKYLRNGEPPRVLMEDVITYHQRLDRQYNVQPGTASDHCP